MSCILLYIQILSGNLMRIINRLQRVWDENKNRFLQYKKHLIYYKKVVLVVYTYVKKISVSTSTLT